ncbi:MAG: PepSY-like domain-containing protein [Bacteroidaceae bacterium]|nr:PepSY-like domain-containing protein [Bacteroidaceae bacterium]
MKNLIVLLACIFIQQTTALADNDKPTTIDQLPAAAQNFIKANFAGVSIAIAKIENDFLDKSYDVIFTNGNKVEFNKKGQWTDIDCKYTEVPASAVPVAIKDYVNKNHSGAKILKIEIENRNYDVKLSNGWELTFNKKFHIVDIDR